MRPQAAVDDVNFATTQSAQAGRSLFELVVIIAHHPHPYYQHNLCIGVPLARCSNNVRPARLLPIACI